MKKLISIGSDRKIFEENSSVRKRQIEYGKYFDELHIIVFSIKNQKLKAGKISENVWVYPTNSKNKLLYIYDAFNLSKNLIKNSRNNVIVSCQDPFEAGIVGSSLKLFFNLPLHTQLHTDFMHKYFSQGSILNKLRFFIGEFVLGYSDRIRVVSERVKNSISQLSKNVDVLPIRAEVSQGQSLGKFSKAQPWKTEKPFSFTLLMVCRLEKEKNIEVVLEAIKKLNKENIGLCIVGDGSQRKSLELRAKSLKLGDKIKFVGWKDDLASYYKMVDVFISSSLYEGYGVSTVEAAFWGKPLILSDTGVAGEMFKEGESAFICDAKNVDCFAQNILKIYEDKNLALKMGQSAKKLAEEHLQSGINYFKEYANSVIKTVENFKERNFLLRIINFKKIAFKSVILLRYFICGLTAAATNIGFLYIFTDIVGIWYLYSSILSFLIALVLSFTLQKFVVFRDNKISKIHHQFSKFFVVAVLGVITNTILIFIFVDMFDIWYILAQIFSGFFVMIQNFILYKFFIFNK